ncbi:MAG: ATP-binding protein [bacterium]|nr:ATP-binding protein [bacterium]
MTRNPAEQLRPTILIVDDNQEFLRAIEEILSLKAGFHVVCLSDGRKTMEVAAREQPDVIVLDVYMPGTDGPTICRWLKSTKKLANIPVLFLTAVDVDSNFRARCLDEGGDDFLQKPVGAEELLARIRVLLRIKTLQDTLRRERDELELKVKERALELKQKETFAAIGKMVAGVAHEIRNPLGAISNSAAVLSRDLILEGEDLKLMEIIVGESARLRETINHFLTFAHPPPCHFTPVEISKLVEDTLILVRRDSLCGPGVNLEVQIEPDVGVIEADRDRLHQVLWNLIRNALEAISGQGTVQIRISTETVNGTPGISLIVQDDGSGIPEEDHEHVFEPFFTRKVRGSGLGLASVAGIVNSHNGSIDLQSAKGQGARFHLWLPDTQELESSLIGETYGTNLSR